MPIPENDKSAIVVPFGKHKGRTVAELLTHDPSYAEWITNQGWVAERFAELHAAILSRGAASDDSPEHNLIQARFLEPLFRAAFALAAQGTPWTVASWKLDRIRNYKRWIADPTDTATGKIEDIQFWSDARFEQRGVDVVLAWDFRLPGHYGWDSPHLSHNIEIKPSLGDDFPSVMRQMQRLGSSALLIDRYASVLPLETLRQMFAANGIHLVTVREVEAELANARAELSP
jgi:hypothetical protein